MRIQGNSVRRDRFYRSRDGPYIRILLYCEFRKFWTS